MYELAKNQEVERLIALTKSDSGVSGAELAKAHIRLGELLGTQMKGFSPSDTTVVAVLRGGIFFGLGLYFQLGCRFEMYHPKCEKFHRPETQHVIIADSVIHTGKTIEKILDKDMTVACCVINEHAVPLFERQLYTVRISKNSFYGSAVKTQRGTIGPDTTMRLFNQL